MFAWSHNFYATYTKGKVTTYYCFEQKKDRDEALKYHFHKCTAQEAYKNYHRMKRIEWREFDRFIKPYRTKIMPCACLRCKKSIPITYGTMAEVSYTHYSYCEDCLRKGLKALKALEDSRWIPVKERLPEEEGYYLVTVFDDWRHISEICIEYWWGKRQDWSTALEVIAWKPLSKPYEGSEEDA